MLINSSSSLTTKNFENQIGQKISYLDDELNDVNQSCISGDQDLLESQEFLPIQLLIRLVWVDTQGKENAVADDLLDLREHIKIRLEDANKDALFYEYLEFSI